MLAAPRRLFLVAGIDMARVAIAIATTKQPGLLESRGVWRRQRQRMEGRLRRLTVLFYFTGAIRSVEPETGLARGKATACCFDGRRSKDDAIALAPPVGSFDGSGFGGVDDR